MDAQFWINAWNEGRTKFHQEEYHQKLTEYFPTLHPKKGQSVLVPLCGKSKDLLWLHDLKLNVRGVELHHDAVESFFSENKLSPMQKLQDQDFTHYSYENIVISCGDFFKINENNAYDFVYDRASLVALPFEMRKNYAEVIKRSLKVGGKYLLIVYEYDQSKLEGPPFSVSSEEIQELYKDQFLIKHLSSDTVTKNGDRPSTVEGLRQVVYLLEKVN